MQAKDHKLLDRAAMIEAASRSLRQQMRARERPRSKGSLHDMKDTRDARDAGAVVSDSPPQQETSQRRIHSAENKYRMVQRDNVDPQSASSSALETYQAAQAEDEPSQAVTNTSGPDLENVPPLGELKRPMSRKKVPSASAAAGLGACSNPVAMTGAFEQRKTRQPIPIESWGPRPPSRHRMPPNSALLDASLLAAPAVGEERSEPKMIASGASRSRSEAGSLSGRPNSRAGNESAASGPQWAAARYPRPLGASTPGLSEPRGVARGRKGKDWGSPEDLGIWGVSQAGRASAAGTRSPNGQQLTKNMSAVFDHHSSQFRDSMAERQAAAQASGSWAAHVDTAGALEVSGSALSDDKNLWLSSSGISMRKSRHPEAVSVEDFEADPDMGLRTNSFAKRPSTPTQPQVIVTRSKQQKEQRGDQRRGRDERLTRGRRSVVQGTSLDVDFLSLFAL